MSGKGVAALPGHLAPFTNTPNCTDATQPLNAWGVGAMAILHHVDLDLAAREVLRVLKPGGRAIFQEPVRNSGALGLLRRLVPYRAPDISPFERPLTDGQLRRFAEGFSRCEARAFELPPVQIGRLFRRLRNRGHALYEWDRRLLRAAPWLARYASIRVISLTK